MFILTVKTIFIKSALVSCCCHVLSRDMLKETRKQMIVHDQTLSDEMVPIIVPFRHVALNHQQLYIYVMHICLIFVYSFDFSFGMTRCCYARLGTAHYVTVLQDVLLSMTIYLFNIPISINHLMHNKLRDKWMKYFR